jgi:hypothetical protein
MNQNFLRGGTLALLPWTLLWARGLGQAAVLEAGGNLTLDQAIGKPY